VTAIADLISRADRDRLRKRQADLGTLDRLMRERVSLPPAPVPVPLHRWRNDETATATTRPRQAAHSWPTMNAWHPRDAPNPAARYGSPLAPTGPAVTTATTAGSPTGWHRWAPTLPQCQPGVTASTMALMAATTRKEQHD
jgi:hypothetical protein